MTKKLKVAFINQPLDHVLPPHQNSIGIWTYQIARQISDTFEVTCYAKLMQGQTEKVEYDGSVRYQFMRMAPVRLWERFTDLFGRFFTMQKPLFAMGFYFLDFIVPIALDIRMKQIDVVHIHNFTQFVPVVRALNPNVKIILHMNGEWLSQLDRQLMKKRIAQADLVLGSSDHIRDLVRDRFPEFTNKVQTVYNGVDITHFVPRRSSPSLHQIGNELTANAITGVTTHSSVNSTTSGPDEVIPTEDSKSIDRDVNVSLGTVLLFVGRISPEKGIHVLIDAFTIVGEQNPHVTLNIVGPEGEIAFEYLVGLSDDPQVAALAEFYDGSYAEDLRERVPPHLRERVVFTGPLAQTDLLNQYHQADILVNPSFSESFGMSLVEAMACERPVVASRIGGMKGVVKDGVTGYLVKQGDPQILADAILDLLNNPTKRKEMGEAGRSRAHALFSWEQVGCEWSNRVGELHEYG